MTLKNVNPRDCPTAGLRPRGGNDYTAESLYLVGVECGTRVPLFPPVVVGLVVGVVLSVVEMVVVQEADGVGSQAVAIPCMCRPVWVEDELAGVKSILDDMAVLSPVITQTLSLELAHCRKPVVGMLMREPPEIR